MGCAIGAPETASASRAATRASRKATWAAIASSLYETACALNSAAAAEAAAAASLRYSANSDSVWSGSSASASGDAHGSPAGGTEYRTHKSSGSCIKATSSDEASEANASHARLYAMSSGSSPSLATLRSSGSIAALACASALARALRYDSRAPSSALAASALSSSSVAVS